MYGKFEGKRKLYSRQRGCAKRHLIDEDNRPFPAIRVARDIVLGGSLLVEEVYNRRLLLSLIWAPTTDPVNNPPVAHFG
jgi:hypothetical protein